MLTSILSRVFLYGFVLCLIGGILDIIAQIVLKPLTFKTGKTSTVTLGQPGLTFDGRVTSRHERTAPDTLVVYSYSNKMGNNGNGSLQLNNDASFNSKEELSRLIKEKRANGDEVIIDTQVTFIGEIKWENKYPSTAITGPDSIEVNKFVNTKSYMDENQKKIKDETDTFATRKEAERSLFLSQYNTPYKISEEFGEYHSLRILPANKWEQFFFILYRLIQIICSAFIFLNLSRLFKNFFNRHYFTYRNVSLLKKLGWYILIPQFLNVIFYWSFLHHIHPVKIFASYSALSGVKMLRQYDLESGLEWSLSFVALSIIVLSHIFKDGLKMKEEQQLTV